MYAYGAYWACAVLSPPHPQKVEKIADDNFMPLPHSRILAAPSFTGQAWVGYWPCWLCGIFSPFSAYTLQGHEGSVENDVVKMRMHAYGCTEHILGNPSLVKYQ
jgi:hypothetical protein